VIKSLLLCGLLLLSPGLSAGLGEWIYEKKSVDCASGVRPNPSSQGSELNLFNCFGLAPLKQSEIDHFYRASEVLRQDLELWVYLKSASKKILKKTKRRIAEFSKMQGNLKKGHMSPKLLKLYDSYAVLRELYQRKRKYEYFAFHCSSLAFWTDKEKNKKWCSFVGSERYKTEKFEIDEMIYRETALNSLFFLPAFQETFENIGHPPKQVHPYTLAQDFIKKMQNSLTKSLRGLKSRKQKHLRLGELPLSKKHLKQIFSDKQLLSEVVAIDYSPRSIEYLDAGNESRSLTLAAAECRVKQKISGAELDSLGWGTAVDLALIAPPLIALKLAQGVILVGKNGWKVGQLVRRARNILLATEATVGGASYLLLKKEENKCKKLLATSAQHTVAPASLKREITTCYAILRNLTRSHAIALLGGLGAIKLLKFDIQNLRIGRIKRQGKESLLNRVSQAGLATASPILKQADALSRQNSPPGFSPTKKKNKKTTQSSTGKYKKPKDTQADRRLIVRSYSDEFTTLYRNSKCSRDPQCASFIANIRPGLERLTQREGQGEQISAMLIAKLARGHFVELSQPLLSQIEKCLKEKFDQQNCPVAELQALTSLWQLKWDKNIPYHPHYFKNLLQTIKRDPENPKTLNAVQLLTQYKLDPQASLQGQANYTLKNNHYYDRKGHITEPLPDLVREDQAAQLLQQLGLNTIQLATDTKVKGARKTTDSITELFTELKKSEGIGASRNPDLIIDEKFFVDIFSPAAQVTPQTLATIAGKVIEKSDVKRQTNRVAIHLSKIRNDISLSQVVAALRQQIGDQSPEHLHEAFIIMKKNGKPVMIPVWP